MRVKYQHAELLDATKCQRCIRTIKHDDKRARSFFNTDVLCGCCLFDEETLKTQLHNKGLNSDDYYKCGYVPLVAKEPQFRLKHKKLRIKEPE